MLSGIATTEQHHIVCKSCKQSVHVDDIGDHECSSQPLLLHRSCTKTAFMEKFAPVEVILSPQPVSKPQLPQVISPPAPVTRQSSMEWASLIQSRIQKVNVCKEGFAKYVIVTSLWSSGPEFVVERRYREFYKLAQMLYTMHPSEDVWHRLPPKLYCQHAKSLTDGFLLRRKVGLEGFLVAAIDMLLNPNSAGPSSKRTLTQLHVLNDFLGLPASKDVNGAVKELKQHAEVSPGWNKVLVYKPGDILYEKTTDCFLALKRQVTLPFPPRAILDVLVTSPSTSEAKRLNPFLIGGEVIRKESNHLWIEHTVYRTFWGLQCAEFFNVKSWRVEPSGAIIVVTIPASEKDYPSDYKNSRYHRADCILNGWILTPDPANSNSCLVTMVLQIDYRRSLTRWNRTLALRHAAELSSVEMYLTQTFDKSYYDALGPLVSQDGLKDLQLEIKDTQTTNNKDPKVYAVCQQIEPMFCMLIHKNTNRNALVLKLNLDLRSQSALQLHPKEPLLAEWIMFEKKNNPRKDLSAIERNTTYEFTTRSIGQGVFIVNFGILRGKDFQLRVGKEAGYNMYGTIKGIPNMRVKRFFLTFGPSLVGMGNLESIQIIGESETELVVVK
ncbi:hypothetical protein THRCLA_10543 [Thraustotheca clavata]|uniref:PX domain-containing protein n=1 Tax=Thraustotheca clavata TaxID=74557 RepID=A0A1V9YL93_9STRA|nr:hypothetical protein THRCLA_10543 [Thraustotheca clavata]